VPLIDDADGSNVTPHEWDDYHDVDRPDGALQDRTPYERPLPKTDTPV
jgi:hypothetical protein